jgi:hypothetical protein
MMYDIVMFSAVLAAADRFRETYGYVDFLGLFKEDQHESITDILYEFGYVEHYWTTRMDANHTGNPSIKWTDRIKEN